MTADISISPNGAEPVKLSRADFVPDVTVRWCPGCGDYNILSAIQSTLPTLGKKKEDFVFISGIGCSSRFPYYLSTYGFHTIHGRAPAIATGVKAANPNLDVWVITGDGDGLSIGGNHMIHALRRNVDLKILLFNNEIYGLTKGQASPTSKPGIRTGSTPYGSVDSPLNPIALALGAGATFIARTADNDPKHMQAVFAAAARHKGTAFIEILQNCVIFNNKVHEPYYGRETRTDTLLYLENGQPLRHGPEGSKGIFLQGVNPVVGEIAPTDGRTLDRVLVHDTADSLGQLAWMLAHFSHPDYPVPLGVFRDLQRPDYHSQVRGQMEQVRQIEGAGKLEKLFRSGVVWEVG